MSRPVFNRLNFDGVEEEVLEAVKQAATETAAAAAEEAKGSRLDLPPHSAAGHPWYAFTDRVESEVSSTEAVMSEGVIFAEFGATKRRGDYALMLERMRPYLRPVFDRYAPQLAARTREILEES